MWRFKLLVLGLAIYGGVMLVKRARARLEASVFDATGGDDPSITDADLVIVAVESGIADVDPEGLRDRFPR